MNESLFVCTYLNIICLHERLYGTVVMLRLFCLAVICRVKWHGVSAKRKLSFTESDEEKRLICFSAKSK